MNSHRKGNMPETSDLRLITNFSNPCIVLLHAYTWLVTNFPSLHMVSFLQFIVHEIVKTHILINDGCQVNQFDQSCDMNDNLNSFI